MSSNYLFNSIDIIKDKSIDSIKIDSKNIQKLLKNKKNISKNKKSEFFEYKQQLMSLEESYKDSLILLNILKKHKKNKVLEKYDVEKLISLKKNAEKFINQNNTDTIQKILMKKKFLTTPLHLFPIVN